MNLPPSFRFPVVVGLVTLASWVAPATSSAARCGIVEGSRCLSGKPTFAYEEQFFSADGRPLAGVPINFVFRQGRGRHAIRLRATETGSVCFRWYRLAAID